jgi:glutamate-1-semialdehyde 2,1-aminomutase
VLQSGGNMFSVFLDPAVETVRDFADASTQDTGAYRAFFHAMLDQGVYLPPSAFEAWFVSAAHDDRAIQHVLDALPAAAEAASRALAPGAGKPQRAESGLQ